MVRRAGYLAITISLLISGTLPVAWAASSRIQQARVRRIKACVVRVPSMGEPPPAVGPATNPFPANSLPDPDAVLTENNPTPLLRRSVARNQLLFYTLQQRTDVKPDGWEFVNPAAAPYATLEISQRYPGLTQGAPIKSSQAAYWEVVLSEANYAALSEMDVIYLPISRNDPSQLPQDIPIVNYFTEEQRRVLTRLADSGVTIWVDWAINNATINGALGGNEGSTPLTRQRNAFFTNLDGKTSASAVAIAPLIGHPLLNGAFSIDSADAVNIGSPWNTGDPRPSLGRVFELRALDMQPSTNFTTVVRSTGAPNPQDGAYIAAGRFGAGYVVATAGNVGGALGSATSADMEDLQFAYNLCAWSAEITAQQKNGRHTGQSSVQINGMIEQWSYPHLARQSSGLWESYPPRGVALNTLPVNPVSPLIIDNVVISANRWLNNGMVMSELNAFEVRPEDDFDDNRFIDDPLNPASAANNDFADISVGQSYDRVMGAPVSGPISGMSVGDVPEPGTEQGSKAYVFALGPVGLFSLPAPRHNLPSADFWGNSGVIKNAPALSPTPIAYNAAPGFAILPGLTGYTRAQLYAGGVVTGTPAFGGSLNGKLVSWGIGPNGTFGAIPEWVYPPAQESNRFGLVSGPVVTAKIVDEGSGAVDTMVLATTCASGDVSGQQGPNGAGDTTGKVEGFIVATQGDVLSFPKNTMQPGANTPNAGRRFVCARWLDVLPGQGQVPQARELIWDQSRHYEVRVMDKQRNYVLLRYLPMDLNLLPDGTAGQVELPAPPAAFAAPGLPGVWDTTRFVFLADYSPLPQVVDQTGGATLRPRFSPQTPYVRGVQQIVEPTGIAGGVGVGSDNRVYYGTGKGYMCSVKWNRGQPKFAWKMRGLGGLQTGQSQNVDPTSPGYLADYAFTSAPAAGRRIVFASKTGTVYVLEPDATIRGKIMARAGDPGRMDGRWPLTAVSGNEVTLGADHGVGFNAASPFIRPNQQPWGRLPNQFTVDPDTATVTFNNMENFSLDLNNALSSFQVQTAYGIDTQGKPAVVIPWKFVGEGPNAPIGEGAVVVPLPVVAVYQPAGGEQFLSGPVIAGERVYIMGASGILHEFPLDPKVLDPSFPKNTSAIAGLNGYNVGNTGIYPPSGLVKVRNIAYGIGVPSVAPPAISEKFVAICTPRGLTAYAAPNVLVADSNRIVEATGDATAVASTDVVVKTYLNLSDFAIPTDAPAGFAGTILTQRQFLSRPAAVRKLNRNGSLTSLFNSSNGTVPGTTADPKSAITENSVLADESYLAADTGNNRIVEFNPAGKVVGEWTAFQDPFSYLPPGETTKLSGPMDVQRWVEVENLGGTDVYVIHTLVADTGNSRVVEIVDKIRYQAGNFNSGSFVTASGQVGADGQPIRWYHVLVWSSQTNAQGMKLRYRNAQRVFWPDVSGNLIPVSAGTNRAATTVPPYLPEERFLSYTMATVQGQTVQYPTQGVTVNGYHQYYGAAPASVIDRLPIVKPGGDSIVFLRGRYKVDETTSGAAAVVPDLREAKPGSPANAERYRFAQGVVDPNVPIISEIADEVTQGGPVSNNPVHRLNGVSSIQRTIRSDIKFAPWTWGSSAPVRYPYFLVADVDGVWECRMLPSTSPPRFSLTLAFTNEDYAYVTGAGNGDPALLYSTAPGAHAPGGRRFSAASARRLTNGLLLITSRTGANELPVGGMSNANSHWHLGADVFLLRSTDYMTASERLANSLTGPYLRVDVTNPMSPRHTALEHGWQPDQWVQNQYTGAIPPFLQGRPSIRWRASESADPTKAPTQRTQFTAPGAGNPSDLFGSYQPSQPAFADLVY